MLLIIENHLGFNMAEYVGWQYRRITEAVEGGMAQ